MENKQTITALTECITKEMERMKYSPLTVRALLLDTRRFAKFTREKTGNDIFTEELGAQYLREKIGFPFNKPRVLTSVEASYIRCVRRLGEYKLHKALLRNKLSHKNTDVPWLLGDQKIISAFLESVQTADNSEATKKIRMHHIKLFYEFLSFRRVIGIREISVQIISDYAKSLQGYSPVYTKHLLATLRFYFRFLHQNGLSQHDWSFTVPKTVIPKHMTVPTLWEQSELENLLKSIDRGNPKGKRDYAIILLVVQLGLRIADVSNLQLSNLKWESNEIELIQHKTGNKIIHPLLGDVGWAIIDYIKYARPKVDEPFVFITINAPYTKIVPGAIGSILQRSMQSCGIQKKAGTVSGMHSLRHALARRLLKKGTPLPQIAEIMGHTSYCSTSPYLKIDTDGLRECSLSLRGEL